MLKDENENPCATLITLFMMVVASSVSKLEKDHTSPAVASLVNSEIDRVLQYVGRLGPFNGPRCQDPKFHLLYAARPAVRDVDRFFDGQVQPVVVVRGTRADY